MKEKREAIVIQKLSQKRPAIEGRRRLHLASLSVLRQVVLVHRDEAVIG